MITSAVTAGNPAPPVELGSGEHRRTFGEAVVPLLNVLYANQTPLKEGPPSLSSRSAH